MNNAQSIARDPRDKSKLLFTVSDPNQSDQFVCISGSPEGLRHLAEILMAHANRDEAKMGGCTLKLSDSDFAPGIIEKPLKGKPSFGISLHSHEGFFLPTTGPIGPYDERNCKEN